MDIGSVFLVAAFAALVVNVVFSPTFRNDFKNFWDLGLRKEVPAPGLPTLPDSTPFDETVVDRKPVHTPGKIGPSFEDGV